LDSAKQSLNSRLTSRAFSGLTFCFFLLRSVVPRLASWVEGLLALGA